MTLLVTEIHVTNAPDNTVIIFVADSEISRGGMYEDSRRKIMRISSLNAGIGYFGLAEIPRSTGSVPMDTWLEDFISRQINTNSLQQFATSLADSLNNAVPDGVRQNTGSGFHLAGFDSEGYPEFWYVRNLADDRETVTGIYEPRLDFDRDRTLRLSSGVLPIFRNGDLRAHEATWETMDAGLGQLLTSPDFRGLDTLADYEDWVGFKMRVVADFYEQFCRFSIIGQPVDVFALTNASP